MLREIECMYESPVVEYEINDPFTSLEEVRQNEVKNFKKNFISRLLCLGYRTNGKANKTLTIDR